MPTLSLDGVDLWYEETGTGRPLVFLHGGWVDSRGWDQQVAHFAEDYRVITFDTRGHGRTGATDPSRYSLDLYADDLERLLDHLDVDAPILCGISQGGMIVQTYIDRHPDRAAAAIIAGPVRSMLPFDAPQAVKTAFTPLPALAASLALTGTGVTFQSLLGSARSMTGGRWLTLDDDVYSAAVDTVREMTAGEFRKTFEALYSFDPPSLTHVTTPVLAIYGDQEACSIKRHGREIAGMVETGTVVEIADAAHLVNQDRPDAFNAAVADFLEQHGLD